MAKASCLPLILSLVRTTEHSQAKPAAAADAAATCQQQSSPSSQIPPARSICSLASPSVAANSIRICSLASPSVVANSIHSARVRRRLFCKLICHHDAIVMGASIFQIIRRIVSLAVGQGQCAVFRTWYINQRPFPQTMSSVPLLFTGSTR